MATGKWRMPPQPPPVISEVSTSIVADAKGLIARSRKLHDQIVDDVRPDSATFANVLVPLAHIDNMIANEGNLLGFYQAVSPNPDLREASREAKRLLDAFALEIATREDLFILVDAVVQDNVRSSGYSKKDPDLESDRFLEKTHKKFIRSGLGLSAGMQRNRFKEVQRRLDELKIDFQRNLVEESTGVWFHLRDLEGVPEDILSGLEKNESENRLHVPLKYTYLFPVLSYADSIETRRHLSVANETKCKNNVPLFKEAMVLRNEAAHLLGYQNHAAFCIEDKMAKTPETVNSFLRDLWSRLKPGGFREIEKLKQFKKMDTDSRGDSSDGFYFLWDHRFYDRLMREVEYSLDEQKLSEYFPLQSTLQGILHIFEQLFGLVFYNITGEEVGNIAGGGGDIIWHEDVQIFSVWDDDKEGGGFVGYLYLDLFPRDGKYRHAANFNLRPVCTILSGFFF